MQSNFQKFKKGPLIFSITFFVFFCFIFVLLNKEVNDNLKIEKLAREEFQTKAREREEVKLLEHSVKAIDSERVMLDSHFTQGSNVVPFLDTIEKLALNAKTKSEITGVDIAENKTGLLVAIKATGSFESLYKFLMLLENSTYELEFVSVDMRNLNVEITNEKPMSPQWVANFRVKLLSFIP